MRLIGAEAKNMSEREERAGAFQAAAAAAPSSAAGVAGAPAATRGAGAATVSPAAAVARAAAAAALPEAAAASLALKKELVGDETATRQNSAETNAGKDGTRIFHSYEPARPQTGLGSSTSEAGSVGSSSSSAALGGRPSGSGNESRAVQPSKTARSTSPSSSSTSDGSNRSGRCGSGNAGGRNSSSGGNSLLNILGSSSSSSSSGPSSVGDSSRRMPDGTGGSVPSTRAVVSSTSNSNVTRSVNSNNSSREGNEGLLGSILEVLKDRYSVDSATLLPLKRAVAAATVEKKTETHATSAKEAAAGEQLRTSTAARGYGAPAGIATSSSSAASCSAAGEETAATGRAAADAAAAARLARLSGAAKRGPGTVIHASGSPPAASILQARAGPSVGVGHPLQRTAAAARAVASSAFPARGSRVTVGPWRGGAPAAAAAGAGLPRAALRVSQSGFLRGRSSSSNYGSRAFHGRQSSNSAGQGRVRPNSSSSGEAGGDSSSSTRRSSKAAAAATLTTYEQVYNRYVVWVLSCAEDSKDELMDVAFAVLLHMFRKLLSMGEPLKAWQLLSRCAYPHASRHKALLQQLEKQQVFHPLQLREFPYFSAAERHPLYISESAYQLLRSRLLETRSLLLEVMIQASVRLLPSPARGGGQQPAAPRGLVYPVERTAAAAETGQLQLLPQPHVGQAPAAAAAQAGAAGAAAGLREGEEERGPREAADARGAPAGGSTGTRSAGGDGGGQEKKNRPHADSSSSSGGGGGGGAVAPVFWGLPRQFCREEYVVSGRGSEKLRRVRVLGGENLREGELVDGRCLLPLPEPNQEAFLLYKRVLRQQSERRMPLSAAGGQLPSIACVSVLNASSDLSACAISPATSKMIALGGEGEILLWNLQEYEVAKARREQRRRRRLQAVQQQQAQEGVCLSVSRALFSSSSSSSSSSSGGSSSSEDEGGGGGAAAGSSRRKTRSRWHDGRRRDSNSSSSGEVRKWADWEKRRERREKRRAEDEEEDVAGARRLVGAEGRVLSLAFGELDDRILLSGGVDGVVRLWQSYDLASWAATADETALLPALQQEARLSHAAAVAGSWGGPAAGGKTALSDRGRRLAAYFHRKQRRVFANCCSSSTPDGSSSGNAVPRTADAQTPQPYTPQQQEPQRQTQQHTQRREKRRPDEIADSNVVVPLCLYRGGLAAVWSVDVGPYGHYFASGSSDGFARLWCTSRSFPLRLLPHPGAAAADVFHVSFHPNSSLLLTAAADACVRLFDLRTAEQARCWTAGAAVAAAAAAAAEQQQQLLRSSRRFHKARQRRLEPQQPTEKSSSRSSSSPAAEGQGEGERGGGGGGNGREAKKSTEKEGKAETAAAAPAAANPPIDGTVPQRNIDLHVNSRKLQPASGAGGATAAGGGSNSSTLLQQGKGSYKKTRLSSIAVSPNGKLVAVSGEEGSICVYDIPSAKLLAMTSSTPNLPMAPVTSLSFCRGSVLLAAACKDGTVSLFDTSSAGLRGPSIFSAETATAAVTPLRLVQTFGASHVAFRSCVFTPENLLVCLGVSTLGSDTFLSL